MWTSQQKGQVRLQMLKPLQPRYAKRVLTSAVLQEPLCGCAAARPIWLSLGIHLTAAPLSFTEKQLYYCALEQMH